MMIIRHPPGGSFHPASPLDAVAVRDAVLSGASCTGLARDMGVSPASVRRASKRAGLNPSGRQLSSTLRQAVKGMTESEALEYALEAYDTLSGQDMRPEDMPPVKLSAQQMVIYCLMKRRLGRTVPFGAIASVMDAASRDAETDERVMKAQIYNVRRKLARYFSVTNVHGVGYKMEAL